jgi:hypothetical protein
VSVFVGTLTLVGCASNTASTTSAAAAPASKPNVVVRAATAEETAKIPDGYTLIKRNGTDFYCHDERVLGSRTQMKQICETKEQMDASRNKATKAVDYVNGR